MSFQNVGPERSTELELNVFFTKTADGAGTSRVKRTAWLDSTIVLSCTQPSQIRNRELYPTDIYLVLRLNWSPLYAQKGK